MAFVVPDEFMIPLGALITKEMKQCADSWTDSTIRLYRVQLPVEFHSTPEDALRARWITIRKKPTPGYCVNGRGPQKGSRKKVKRHKPPKWYQEYIDSAGWQSRRIEWLVFWGYRCAVCNASSKEVILDIHHRTYERIRNEQLVDCIVICRRCHDIYHTQIQTEPIPRV